MSRPARGDSPSSSSSSSACTPAISSPWMPASKTAVGPATGASRTCTGRVGKNQWTPAERRTQSPICLAMMIFMISFVPA